MVDPARQSPAAKTARHRGRQRGIGQDEALLVEADQVLDQGGVRRQSDEDEHAVDVDLPRLAGRVGEHDMVELLVAAELDGAEPVTTSIFGFSATFCPTTLLAVSLSSRVAMVTLSANGSGRASPRRPSCRRR